MSIYLKNFELVLTNIRLFYPSDEKIISKKDVEDVLSLLEKKKNQFISEVEKGSRPAPTNISIQTKRKVFHTVIEKLFPSISKSFSYNDTDERAIAMTVLLFGHIVINYKRTGTALPNYESYLNLLLMSLDFKIINVTESAYIQNIVNGISPLARTIVNGGKIGNNGRGTITPLLYAPVINDALNLFKLSSSTDKNPNRERTAIGVGEGVTIYSDVPVTWSIDSDLANIGIKTVDSIHITALDKIGILTITAKSENSDDINLIQFIIIEPSDIYYEVTKKNTC